MNIEETRSRKAIANEIAELADRHKAERPAVGAVLYALSGALLVGFEQDLACRIKPILVEYMRIFESPSIDL